MSHRTKACTFAIVAVAACAGGCKREAKTYDTTVEVMQVQRFGSDPKVPGLMDLELKFSDCPGDARRLVRADKAFSACAGAIKEKDKLPAKVTQKWNPERGNYRSDIVSIGACELKVDPKEEANYEMVQVCTDLQATGATVGVHCDRTRPPSLTDKCPFLKRD